MEWIRLKDNKDLENFMYTFGGFHDSCLKELYMWTDSYVDEHLSMSPLPHTNVRILFQRQYRNPSAIELLFSGVAQFHIVPNPENYDSIIYDAKLVFHEGLFYWSNDYYWEPNNISMSTTSWISSTSIRWRDVSHWMGKDNRYGVIGEE